MSVPETSTSPPQSIERAPSPEQTLRSLFLTLFLRGRSSRGLKKQSAPTSIAQKLSLTLVFYALFGLISLTLVGQPIFPLSVYLHAMTFMFLGMFVAASTGEILFNKEEADILLHRPVAAKSLLWAKVRVLVEVSLWLAAAFNLAGFFVGFSAPDGGWRFPIVHAMSTALEALFCTGCVVAGYQLCLRWFGRERLEGLMTAAQVLVSVAAVLAGQLVPHLMFRLGHFTAFGPTTWWIVLLPPAWFAGLDDAFAGSSAAGSWLLAAIGLVATGAVAWAAFSKLSRDYQTGLQLLGETVSRRRGRPERRRKMDRLLELPPLRWWLRDPVARATFLLTAAYLLRDRDVKLRVYPGLAPLLVLPILTAFQGDGFGGDFVAASATAYVGVLPLLAIGMLQYSQQWQASDVFRITPIAGPARLGEGVRRAVFIFIELPAAVCFGLMVWLPRRDVAQLPMLLPGLILVPVCALIPALANGGVPFSVAPEESKAASRGLTMVSGLLCSFAIAGGAMFAKHEGFFWRFLSVETVVAAAAYVVLRRALANTRWPSLD